MVKKTIMSQRNLETIAPTPAPQSSDISIIIQGDIREESPLCLSRARAIFPEAEIIFATYEGSEIPSDFECKTLMIPDPGDQDPATRNPKAPRTNTNRQIATTQAGLAAATRPFALKLRSDVLLQSDQILRLWEKVHRADPTHARLVVPSFFTRNPNGISGYLFHISDWVMFGETGLLRKFWARAPVSAEDLAWFDHARHHWSATPTARRFRARYTAEQHLSIGYAQALGFRVPQFVNETSAALRQDCERFYARHFVIAAPEELGCTLPKYTEATNRLYQQLDNTLYIDWLSMVARHAPDCATALLDMRHAAKALRKRRITLWIIRHLRHALSAGALISLWWRRRKTR